MPRLRLAPIAALAALIALPFSSCGESYEVPTGEGDWILVDLYHTRLQNPIDHRMVKGNYSYQGVHGYSRLFDHLDDNGYPWGVLENFTEDLLARCARGMRRPPRGCQVAAVWPGRSADAPRRHGV